MTTSVKQQFGRPVASRPPTKLAPPEPPSASERRWSFISQQQLGVHAVDPVGHKIGPNIAKKRFVGLNWYPVDRFKQTLIGKVEGYEFYNPGGSGDEADWNIFIRPTPAFQFICDDVLPNADPGALHRAADGAPLVEAEITPDQAFYTNPFFDDQGHSSLVGHKIGVYGPWVQEESHGFRPEIHPCELLWWRDVRQGLNTYHLMVVQDDSNRFDRRSNYSGSVQRPWSMFPRSAEFRLAIRVPNGHKRKIVVDEVFAHNVRRSAQPGSPRISRRRFAKAGATLQVERRIPDVTTVGITFEGFAPAFNGTATIGYVVLKSEVGNDDSGKEGVHVLRVTETA